MSYKYKCARVDAAAAAQGIQTAVVTVTNAQFVAITKTDATKDVTLVPAPGAGKMIVPLAIVIAKVRTADYTGNAVPALVYAGRANNADATGVVVASLATEILATAGVSRPVPAAQLKVAKAVLENRALVMSNTHDDVPGGGNAANTTTFTIQYQVVDI